MHDVTCCAPIAVITHSHPSISKGGAEIAAATLFAGLRELDIRAVLIAAVPYDQRDKVDLGPDEYAVFYDPERYDHFYHLSAPNVSQQLCDVIDQTKARLLIFHHFLHFGLNGLRDATALSRRHAVLVLHEYLTICHHHGQMITEPGRLLCKGATLGGCARCFPDYGKRRFDLRRSRFDRCYQLMAGFIAPSAFLAERFCAWGLPRERLHVIENGLALDISKPHAPRRPERQNFIFGYFGQLNPFKGVDVVLQAAELLAAGLQRPTNIAISLHGNLIGLDDAFTTRLDRLCSALPFLKFFGPYDNRQVLELMSQCDYVLVPSVWWENSPVVIQEAYAAGCPVICTGIGGMAEKVIDGVSGLHFRHGDAASLLEVMLKAAHSSTFAHLQAGIPQPFGAAEMARRYIQTSLSLIACKNQTAAGTDLARELGLTSTAQDSIRARPQRFPLEAVRQQRVMALKRKKQASDKGRVQAQ